MTRLTLQCNFPVIVTGGRDYADGYTVRYTLDDLHGIRAIDLLIHGAAKGADTLAERWARDTMVPYLGVPAQWDKYGKKAGPIRNAEMLDIVTPKCLIAFPGGDGTEDMILKCKKRGIYVLHVVGQRLPEAYPSMEIFEPKS